MQGRDDIVRAGGRHPLEPVDANSAALTSFWRDDSEESNLKQGCQVTL